MIHFLQRGTLLLLSLFYLTSCASLPKGHFISNTGTDPDYSLKKNWAALPTEKDSADAVPLSIWHDVQDTSRVDVFFIHPTTYVGKKGQCEWNASLDDQKLNAQTDKSAIRYQASIFNGAGKIYAPRYRQAHLHCFYEKGNQDDAKQAFELAYRDVKKAFSYYLQNLNQGRPFIIAAHSQGTFHAARLIKEEIENHPLQAQLIVAYLPGMPVRTDYFTSIPPCATPDQTGCFCSWRTFREGYIPPKFHLEGQPVVVTDPVTWRSDLGNSALADQKGAVLRDFNKLYPSLVETKVHEDLLWVSKPRFPWSFLLMTKNYHIADYNFFYGDVRQNAQDRVRAFLNQ